MALWKVDAKQCKNGVLTYVEKMGCGVDWTCALMIINLSINTNTFNTLMRQYKQER
jgi:hypothetical protein